MKTTIAFVAAAGLSVANAQYFGVIAARSASPIHLQEIQANGQALWIGKPSAHYCPSTVQKLGGCPNTHDTNFAGGDGSLAMGAIVPGGQQVYIDPACGAVKYTIAHSASMPQGAIVDGWTHTEGPSFGHLSWKGGLVACNTTANGPYQIYAQLPNVKPPGTCLGFDALTSNTSKADAWQYT